MSKNYYTILGLSPGASIAEIKAAYRRLAKEHHPDKRSGSSEAFLELREAYTVLSDPEQRAAYDRHLHEMRRRAAATTGKTHRTWHPYAAAEPLVGSNFATDPPITTLRGPGVRSRSRPIVRTLGGTLDTTELKRDAEVSVFSVEVLISAHQAWAGGVARIRVPLRSTCPECHGLQGPNSFGCKCCLGSGSIIQKVPIRVPFPARLTTDYAVLVPIEGDEMEERCLAVLFRIVETADF
ncbi:MAG: J domain-containing protein [Kiritimatiellia bacterium]